MLQGATWPPPPPPPPPPPALSDSVPLLDTSNASSAEGRRLASLLADKVGRFDKARLEAVAPNKQILLSFTNRVRLDFARTWAAHLVRIGLSNYLIGATDSGALSGTLERLISLATRFPVFV